MSESRADAALAARVTASIRSVPDFPRAGVLFRDLTPLWGDAELLAAVTAAMASPFEHRGITHVAGIESRGFIVAAAIAHALGAGFIPIRKPGKLPARRLRREYGLEYGTDVLEIHADACPPASRILLVDDVLATGGTAAAAAALLEEAGGAIDACSFLLEIPALRGAAGLRRYDVRSVARV